MVRSFLSAVRSLELRPDDGMVRSSGRMPRLHVYLHAPEAPETTSPIDRLHKNQASSEERVGNWVPFRTKPDGKQRAKTMRVSRAACLFPSPVSFGGSLAWPD